MEDIDDLGDDENKLEFEDMMGLEEILESVYKGGQ